MATLPDEGSGSCSDGQLFIIKHIARTRARCLLCEGGANSKICLILREEFLSEEETFTLAGAKSHQMNDAFDWPVGCKEPLRRACLWWAASSGNEQFV